jgi:hypothetical protein
MDSGRFKKIGLVFNRDEAWNEYKFKKLKIDLNHFKKKKYSKLSYINPNFQNFENSSDVNFLKKLEIYGKINGFIFDFADSYLDYFDFYIFFSVENISDSQKEILYSDKKKFLYLAEPPNVDKNIYNTK